MLDTVEKVVQPDEATTDHVICDLKTAEDRGGRSALRKVDLQRGVRCIEAVRPDDGVVGYGRTREVVRGSANQRIARESVLTDPETAEGCIRRWQRVAHVEVQRPCWECCNSFPRDHIRPHKGVGNVHMAEVHRKRVVRGCDGSREVHNNRVVGYVHQRIRAGHRVGD